MKRKLLFQIAGIIMVSFCTMYLFSSKKGISGMEASDLSEVRAVSAITLPWTESFDNATSFGLWAVIAADESGNIWQRSTTSGKTTPACVALTQKLKTTVDAWLISPAITLEGGGKYKIKYVHHAIYQARKYDVTIGTAPTKEAQTRILDNVEITSVGSAYKEYEVVFDIETTGDYHIGWHCKDEAPTAKWAPILRMDDILLERMTPNELEAISVTGPKMPSAGVASSYVVTVKNWGYEAATGFKVSLINSSDAELASVTYNESLASNATSTISIPWTPTQNGEIPIRAKVSASGDPKPSNDISPSFTVNVQKEGVLGIQIGDGTETGYIPFSYYNSNSFVQTIYYEDEIKESMGIIDRIVYFNSFKSLAVGARPIKIYMSITDKDGLGAGWDIEEAMLVFDGTYEFPTGENDCIIQLQKVFPYSGGNLLITTVRPMDRYYGMYDRFFFSKSEDHSERTRFFRDDKAEFNYEQEGTTSGDYPNILLLTNTNVGKVKGIISDEDGALDGVKVTVKNTESGTISDGTGNYTLVLETGTYEIEVTKVGYVAQSKTITVAKGVESTLNFVMEGIEFIRLDGEVKDGEGAAIEKALVILAGYEDYETTTDSEGKFTIEKVYVDEEYNVTVEKSGYIKYSSTVSVEKLDITLPTITLSSCDNPTVRNLSYTRSGQDGYTVNLLWSHPNSTGDNIFAKPLYADNDSVVTSPGAARDGFNLSEVFESDVYGYGPNKKDNTSIADDFTLTEKSYISDIDFYTYQESALSPRVGEVYVRIYNGKPDAGGQIIWGDFTTNLLEITEFINCYRVKEADTQSGGLNNRNNSIARVKAKINTTLEAGTYWLEVAFESLDEPRRIYVIPCSAKDHRIDGNAILKDEKGNWMSAPAKVVENGYEGNLGLAFAVNGVIDGENYATSYKVYKDNSLLGTIPYFQYTYTNKVSGPGTYNFELAAIWNNECESERINIEVEVPQDSCEIAITEFPFYESFDSGKIGGCWRQEIVNGGDYWKISQGTGSLSGAPASSHSGRYNIVYTTIGKGDMARISTPMMDITQLDSPHLSFYHAQSPWNGSSDKLCVYYKIGLGGNLVKIAEYTESATSWTRRLIPLPAAAKSSELYIVFEGESQNGYGIVLDDISVSGDGCHFVDNYKVQQVWEEMHITWSEPAVSGIESYTLKRNGQVLAEALRPTDNYIDKNIVDGETYEYCLSVNYSDKDCDVPPTDCRTVIAKIDVCQALDTLKYIKHSERAVELFWEIEDSEDITDFVIGFDGMTLVTIEDPSIRSFGIDLVVMPDPAIYSFCIIVRYANRSCPNSLPVCVEVPLGGYDNIEEVNLEKSIKVYPNPVKDGYIKVEGKNLERINIFSSTGQMLKIISYNELGTDSTIPLDSYPAGVYFMKIETSDKQVVTKKFVIAN